MVLTSAPHILKLEQQTYRMHLSITKSGNNSTFLWSSLSTLILENSSASRLVVGISHKTYTIYYMYILKLVLGPGAVASG